MSEAETMDEEGLVDDDERVISCRCDGSGVIVVCCDDLCRGLGECIHGDGEELCPCDSW